MRCACMRDSHVVCIAQCFRPAGQLVMITARKYAVSVNGNVTVSNGSLACPAGGGRQVLVTPLSQQRVNQGVSAGRLLVSNLPTQSSQEQQPRTLVTNPNSLLPKVLLKAHSLNKKILLRRSLFGTSTSLLSILVLISKP